MPFPKTSTVAFSDALSAARREHPNATNEELARHVYHKLDSSLSDTDRQAIEDVSDTYGVYSAGTIQKALRKMIESYDEVIRRMAVKVVDEHFAERVASGKITALPNGRFINTEHLTDEHRKAIEAERSKTSLSTTRTRMDELHHPHDLSSSQVVWVPHLPRARPSLTHEASNGTDATTAITTSHDAGHGHGTSTPVAVAYQRRFSGAPR